jgi:hypothetical protein
MVNSTRGYASLPTRVTRNRREVYVFPHNVRAPSVPHGTLSHNENEGVQCTENAPQTLKPKAAESHPDGAVTFVVQQGSQAMEIHPKETVWAREDVNCVQSAGSALKPLEAVQAALPQLEMTVKESVSVGVPQVAGDKLEGYVPKFFLKEDGKDDFS